MLQASDPIQTSAPASAVALLPKHPTYADLRQMVAACFPDLISADAERLVKALDNIGAAYTVLRHYRASDDRLSDGWFRSAQAIRPSLLAPHAQPHEALARWRKAYQRLCDVLNTLPAPADPAFIGLMDGQRTTFKILSKQKPRKR